jgi:hypothetical protein
LGKRSDAADSLPRFASTGLDDRVIKRFTEALK